MAQGETGTTHNDVLAKMDALLKKHQGPFARPPAPKGVPVLTEIIPQPEDDIPLLTEVVEKPAQLPAFTPLRPAKEALEQQIENILAGQLEPRIKAAIDQALDAMLDQFAVHVEQLVREAVAEELKKQLSALTRRNGKAE